MALRKIVAILICSFYLAGSCVSFIPAVFYFFNKDYVAENFCENKDNVEMHCEGKCYVGKEVIKLNEQKQNTEKPAHHTQLEIFPHESAVSVSLQFFEVTVMLTSSDNTTYLPAPGASSIDMPPELLG